MKARHIIAGAERMVAGTTDQVARLAQHVGVLQGEIMKLCATYGGDGAKPQTGCAFFPATAGDATVLLEYEYEAGEEAVWNLNSPMCGPGVSASVCIIQALVNGRWCDPLDVFSAKVIERWEQQIIDGEDEASREKYEERMAEEAA